MALLKSCLVGAIYRQRSPTLCTCICKISSGIRNLTFKKLTYEYEDDVVTNEFRYDTNGGIVCKFDLSEVNAWCKTAW